MQPSANSEYVDPLVAILDEYDIVDSDLVRDIRETIAAPLKNYLGEDFRVAERIVLNGY